MAATIDEAIQDVVEDIGPKADPDARMTTWLSTMFTNPSSFPGPGTAWDRENTDQRTVYDWVVPTIIAQQQMAALSNLPEKANIAINVVLRTLFAVKFAATNSRITAAQQTSVVTAYTTVWE